MGCGRSKQKVVVAPGNVAAGGRLRRNNKSEEGLQGGGAARVPDKRASRESADLFFSSRKEDASGDDDDVGSEYFSPRCDPAYSADRACDGEIREGVEMAEEEKGDRRVRNRRFFPSFFSKA